MTEREPFDELSSKRQAILKEAVSEFGTEEFNRPEFNDHAGVETTTDTLNKIAEEDGWLDADRQGVDPFVVDTGARDDDLETGVSPSDLASMAHNVLARRGISHDLSGVNFGDWNDVLDTVNRIVGGSVLIIQQEPNKYQIPLKAYDKVTEELE